MPSAFDGEKKPVCIHGSTCKACWGGAQQSTTHGRSQCWWTQIDFHLLLAARRRAEWPQNESRLWEHVSSTIISSGPKTHCRHGLQVRGSAPRAVSWLAPVTTVISCPLPVRAGTDKWAPDIYRLRRRTFCWNSTNVGDQLQTEKRDRLADGFSLGTRFKFPTIWKTINSDNVYSLRKCKLHLRSLPYDCFASKANPTSELIGLSAWTAYTDINTHGTCTIAGPLFLYCP